MIKLTMKSVLILALVIFAQGAKATTAVRVEAQKSLGIQLGDYVVVQTNSSNDRENLCGKGLEHTIKWAGSKEDPVLAIGAAIVFSDFNDGLKTDSQPYYKDHCSYRHSTQAQAGRLIDDTYSNCDSENTTVHTEIIVNGSRLEYSSDIKVSRKSPSKVLSVTTKCTLQKIGAANVKKQIVKVVN